MIFEARLPEPAARVTVIIPTWERTIFLEEALRSVLAQTRPVHQILIVDDGSGAAARHEAERLAGLSDRIECHCLPEHRGAAAARNWGLDLASGDYVLFLDDDDWLHPCMVESSLALLESDASLDVVVCHHTLFCTSQGAPGFWLPSPLPEAMERRPFSTLLRCSAPVNTYLIRRASIGAVRFPEDLAYGEDVYFRLALCRYGLRFAARRERHAMVRRHGRNVTRSETARHHEVRKMYRRLLAEQMVDRRDDYVLLQLKLAYCEWKCGNAAWLSHLGRACRHPLLLLGEFAAVAVRALHDPRGFLRHVLA